VKLTTVVLIFTMLFFEQVHKEQSYEN